MATASVSGWRRHFEGWPVGLSIVLSAAASALLVVPRAVEPDAVPPPVIDRSEQARLVEQETVRAERAARGLSFDVRQVGEAYRRWGASSFAGDGRAELLQSQLQRLARELLDRHLAEQLLDLRALQAQLFVRSLNERADLEPTLERRELGADLFALGRTRGWFGAARSAADPREIGTLFRVHWAEVLGLTGQQPFAPTLNEWRVYYRFLLAQPTAQGSEREGDVRRKLSYVAALARYDQNYPAHLARGILLYQGGSPPEAAQELGAHLRQHPDGPWTLRAKNYLAACGAALAE
ncbi:MAG TPA: hypothetical protein VG963_27535 [Polyangiaceae bacterium]|nr:hypothetical protein [Polyangiaceae bacterium]